MKRTIITLCTLLCLVATAMAEELSGSLYKAISQQSELTGGRYLIVSESGNAALNSNDMTAVKVAIDDGSIILRKSADTFYCTYNSTDQTLSDFSGEKYFAPSMFGILRGDSYKVSIEVTETATTICNATNTGYQIRWVDKNRFSGTTQQYGESVRMYKYAGDVAFTCPHTLISYVAGTTATCGIDGYAEHWVCDVCGAIASDEAFTHIVSLDDLKTARIGNKTYNISTATYDKNVWSVSDPQIRSYIGANTLGSREATFVLDSDAKRFRVEMYFDDNEQVVSPSMKYTIYVNGTKKIEQGLHEELHGAWKYFAYDNAKKGDKVRIIVEKTANLPDLSYERNLYVYLSGTYLNHTIEHLDYADATCCTDGHYETYHCTVCGSYFSDEFGTQQQSANKVVIPSRNGHTLEHVPAAPDCVNGNIEEHWRCEICGMLFRTNAHPQSDAGAVTIEELTHEPIGHHSLEKVDAHPTSCISGVTDHYECTVCHRLFEDAAGAKELQRSDVITTRESTDVTTFITPTNMDGAWSSVESKTIYEFTFKKAARFLSSGTSSQQAKNGIHTTEFIIEEDAPVIVTFALSSMGDGQADFLLRFLHNGNVVYSANKDFMRKNGKFDFIINDAKAGDVIRVELEKQTSYTWNTYDKITYVAFEYAKESQDGHAFEAVPVQYDCINGDIEQHYVCKHCHNLFSSCKNPGSDEDLIESAEVMRSTPRGHHTDADDDLLCDLCGQSLVDESHQCGDNLYWSYDATHQLLSLFGSGSMWDYTADTLPWKSNQRYVATLMLNGEITQVDDNAFSGFSNLKRAYITSQSLYTGNPTYPFPADKTALQVLVPADRLADYVSAWGNAEHLDGIITFEYETTLERCLNAGWDTDNDGMISLTEAQAVKKITSQFMECNSERINELRYFTSVTSIADEAFRYCLNLKEITLPASVTSMSSKVFNGCNSLQSITFLGESAPTFNKNALVGCDNLEAINIAQNYPCYLQYMLGMHRMTNFEVVRYKVTFFLPGKGTEEDPYIATTESDLDNVLAFTSEQFTKFKVSILLPDVEGKHYAYEGFYSYEYVYVADGAFEANESYLVLTENAHPQFVLDPNKSITFDTVWADIETDGITLNPDYPGYEIITNGDKFTSTPIVYAIRFMEGDEEAQFVETYTCPIQYTVENNITLPDSNDIPEHPGYNFAGWYASPDFSGDPVTEIATGTIGDKVFYGKWVTNSFTITDREAYTESRDKLYTDVTYTRTFTDAQAGNWQPLFVPFDITITDELLADADIAIPYMVATEGSSNGGMSDSRGLDVVVLMKLNAGETAQHGTPYFIRPKAAGDLHWAFKSIHLYSSTDATTLTCSTVFNSYAFIGQYAAGKPTADTWYAMGSDGVLHLGDSDSPDLSAQRWYMTKTAKDGVPALALAPAIRVLTWGEDNEATAIVAAQADPSTDVQTIYTIGGMRQQELLPGLNIVNGKKVFIK